MRVINADTIEWFQIVYGADKAKAILILQPHISCLDIFEAEPVVRAEWELWEETLSGDVWIQCSKCGRRVMLDSYSRFYTDKDISRLTELYPYCHCGAKMDGGINK